MIGSATVNDGCDLLDSRYEGSDVNSGWFRAAADGVGNLDLLLINLEKLSGVGPRIGVGVNKGSFGLKYHLELFDIENYLTPLISVDWSRDGLEHVAVTWTRVTGIIWWVRVGADRVSWPWPVDWPVIHTRLLRELQKHVSGHHQDHDHHLVGDRSGGSPQHESLIVRVAGPVGLDGERLLILVELPLPHISRLINTKPEQR